MWGVLEVYCRKFAAHIFYSLEALCCKRCLRVLVLTYVLGLIGLSNASWQVSKQRNLITMTQTCTYLHANAYLHKANTHAYKCARSSRITTSA
uniref:Secreted protein n=1 Tax=Ascaris lumbricoides TaxID=6252 RepID=A0A0M3IB91_ASCLU